MNSTFRAKKKKLTKNTLLLLFALSCNDKSELANEPSNLSLEETTSTFGVQIIQICFIFFVFMEKPFFIFENECEKYKNEMRMEMFFLQI